MTSLQLSPGTARRAVLSRRIRLFAAATISYNLIEAVVALWAGGTADSSALLGFPRTIAVLHGIGAAVL